VNYLIRIEQCLRRRERDLARAQRQLDLDEQSFRCALVPRQAFAGAAAVEQALADEDVCRASALFRFCRAELAGCTAVAAKHRAAARQQYRANRAYLSIFGLALLERLEDPDATPPS